ERILRVGHLEAAELGATALHAAMEDVHVAEEVHHERIRRLLEDLGRRADLLDASLVHDHDPVGHLERLLLVVRDEDAGDVDLVVQPAQPRAQLLTDLRVERTEGLVEQEDLGLGRARPGERHALPLPAGELRRQGLLETLELHQLEQLPHAVADLSLRPLADAQPKPDVVEHCHVAEERVVLEDEPDVALPYRRVGHVLLVVEDRPRIRDLEPRDDPQQRRLARARRPEQREQLAVGHLQADVVECQELPEAFRDVPHRDAHASPPVVSMRAFSSSSRRVFHSSVVFTSRVTSASKASTEATAKAPGMLYSWNSFSTRSGIVSVLPAMCPETTYTAPNSPMARALHRITPYSRPHLMLGSVTSRKSCQLRAPRLTAATSSSEPSASMSGMSSRAITGKVTKMVASTRPGYANTTFRSCARSHGPKMPCIPKRRSRKRPPTTGGTGNGMSV